jgi:oxygen-dependent protoporphyrinogen oxidase
MRTCHELGLADELVYADATLPPWVWWDGKLHALPKNLPGDLFTFNLLSWPGRIRAGLGAIGFPGVVKAADPDKDENIAEFVTRHLGPEAFQRIIEPFVSGVYAGDPAQLSMKSALKKIYRLQQISFNGALVPGGVLRFQEMQREKIESPPEPEWPTFKSGELCSFKKGLQTLPNAVSFFF